MADGAHILVVEDDRDLRESLGDALRLEGYDVVCVEHGEAALRHLATGARPCVILLDLMMPVMDGWAFLSACRADPRCREIPIVVMSAAYDLHKHFKQLTAQGVRAVVAKPFDLQVLLALVQHYAPLDPQRSEDRGSSG